MPEAERPSRSAAGLLPWLALFAAGAAVWAFQLREGEAERAWRAFLVNFLYFTSLAAGLVTWSAIVVASRGRWPEEAERPTLPGTGFALPSLAALGALWAGSPAWSPWHGKALHQGLWLSDVFLFARGGAALLLFWALAWLYGRRRRQGKGTALAGWLVLVYALAFSLLGFDLGMALDPHWYSSLFGGYFFISGLYLAAAAWALLAVLGGRPPQKLHDLGKLVFAFAVLTAYMVYSQLLPIFYENLPHETRFPLARLSGGWRGVSFALAGVWLAPLALLLTVRAKRSRWWLGGVSLLLLVGMWVEKWWIVAPVFDPEPRLGVVELAALAAFLGAAGGSLALAARTMPAKLPEEGEG